MRETSLSKYSINSLGGYFLSGKPFPESTRKTIIKMAKQSFRACEISRSCE
jgi:hypothetical protein